MVRRKDVHQFRHDRVDFGQTTSQSSEDPVLVSIERIPAHLMHSQNSISWKYDVHGLSNRRNRTLESQPNIHTQSGIVSNCPTLGIPHSRTCLTRLHPECFLGRLVERDKSM